MNFGDGFELTNSDVILWAIFLALPSYAAVCRTGAGGGGAEAVRRSSRNESRGTAADARREYRLEFRGRRRLLPTVVRSTDFYFRPGYRLRVAGAGGGFFAFLVMAAAK